MYICIYVYIYIYIICTRGALNHSVILHTHDCACLNIRMHVEQPTYITTYLPTYIHTYIHTCVQILVLGHRPKRVEVPDHGVNALADSLEW